MLWLNLRPQRPYGPLGTGSPGRPRDRLHAATPFICIPAKLVSDTRTPHVAALSDLTLSQAGRRLKKSALPG